MRDLLVMAVTAVMAFGFYGLGYLHGHIRGYGEARNRYVPRGRRMR